ncbi:MAG: winged helix-turn-helix domain-containing protein [Terracidiphilus sp.]|jgi:DNA-binding winged helix-turn-helix (wHTH) protein
MELRRFRFGLFVFDTSSGELKREGAPIRLQAQPARVLSHLLSRAGEVVTREELHQAIWGEETFVDFERGLNVCIAQIRSALGDDSVSPRYVRTIPRHGYQFIAPLERLADSIQEPASQPVVLRRHTWRIIALSSAALLIVAVAVAIGLRWNPVAKSPPAPVTVAVVRFDNETGDPSLTRLSDGLTDTLVEQLTRSDPDRFRVIGNAALLRVPRDQRDLGAIASTLHAQFIVLGQVQRSGSQTRVLAHLIRMPDQTHVWVVRVDKLLDDTLAYQSSVAQQIASEFSPRLAAAAAGKNLSPAPNH